MLIKFTLFIIFCLMFLSEYRFFGIPLPTIILSFIFCVVLFFNKQTKQLLLIKDNVKTILILILLTTIFSYFIGTENVEKIKQIYYTSSGERPNFLYLKISLNGVFFILLSFFFYSSGLALGKNEKNISIIIKSLVNLFTINALILIITWFIQTNGVLGRYNFDLIAVKSFGVNSLYSILGFLLLLSNKKNRKLVSFDKIKMGILLISILIIQTRLNQFLFIIMIIYYFKLMKIKISSIKKIIYFIFSVCFIFIGLPFLLKSGSLDIYTRIFTLEGIDFITRMAVIQSSLEIFKENFIFGVGYGFFSGYNTTPVYITGVSQVLMSPHNGLLAVLSESGLVGLLLNLILIKTILAKLKKNITTSSNINLHNNNYKVVFYSFLLFTSLSGFISSFILFPPPSEYSYYGISFVIWLFIGLSSSNKKLKNCTY